MSSSNKESEQKIAIGQTWFHQGNADEPYRIVEILENATGYESAGQIADPIVLYVQEYNGKVAKKGKRWVRDLKDFFNNFVLKEDS